MTPLELKIAADALLASAPAEQRDRWDDLYPLEDRRTGQRRDFHNADPFVSTTGRPFEEAYQWG